VIAPTERQMCVLRAIYEFTQAHRYAPTMRELGRMVDIRSTNGVNDHLRALERRRCIRRDMLKSRSLQITLVGYARLGVEAPAVDAAAELEQLREHPFLAVFVDMSRDMQTDPDATEDEKDFWRTLAAFLRPSAALAKGSAA